MLFIETIVFVGCGYCGCCVELLSEYFRVNSIEFEMLLPLLMWFVIKFFFSKHDHYAEIAIAKIAYIRDIIKSMMAANEMENGQFHLRFYIRSWNQIYIANSKSINAATWNSNIRKYWPWAKERLFKAIFGLPVIYDFKMSLKLNFDSLKWYSRKSCAPLQSHRISKSFMTSRIGRHKFFEFINTKPAEIPSAGVFVFFFRAY